MSTHRPDPLSPEKLQMFAASIANLPQQEMRQAKLLYIRNAIAELRAQEQIFASFGKMQGASRSSRCFGRCWQCRRK